VFGVGCRSTTHRSVAHRSVGADRQHFSASPPPGRPGPGSGAGPVRDLTPHHRTAGHGATHGPRAFRGPTRRVDTAPVATDDADARRSCSSDAHAGQLEDTFRQELRACATTPASENHCTCHFPAVVDERMPSRPDPQRCRRNRWAHEWGTPRDDRIGTPPGSNVRFHLVAVQRRVRFSPPPGDGIEPPRRT